METSQAASISSPDYIERLEALDRLDRLDERDARDAREAAEARDARDARLVAVDAMDARDAVTAGAEILSALVERFGQTHLVDGWRDGRDEANKIRLMRQVQTLDAACPGGLTGYVERARKLLASSSAGENPLEGIVPSIPTGRALTVGTDEFAAYEAAGVAAAGRSAFVLVAGGLGERLGYSGIKLRLPTELLTGTSYLELFIRHILALQATQPEGSSPIPLVLMTSDDTDARTRALLADHGHFGMVAGQITLLKQEKVPCLKDGDAGLALDPADRFRMLTKPHGHGDVHALLHSSGVVRGPST